jgi:hypothetical protein
VALLRRTFSARKLAGDMLARLNPLQGVLEAAA